MPHWSDNRAWRLLVPAVVVLGVVGALPLLAVVNYGLHDIFTLSLVSWVGLQWFAEILGSDRFLASLGRGGFLAHSDGDGGQADHGGDHRHVRVSDQHRHGDGDDLSVAVAAARHDLAGAKPHRARFHPAGVNGAAAQWRPALLGEAGAGGWPEGQEKRGPVPSDWPKAPGSLDQS